MRLFVAEKPDLARAIVEALGGGAKRDGYFECGGDIVTYCFGHMLMLWDPEDYNENFKHWRMDDLPIVNIPWNKKPGPDKKDQIAVIKRLLTGATEVIHAGDPDDEGQLLVDELLLYLKCRVPVQRLLINDNNPAVVRRALLSMRPNTDYAGLSASAEARSVADQLYGYTMTRAFTIAARERGGEGVWSVGRVQTPILGLVVRRDRAHAGHVAVYYYAVTGTFAFGTIAFPGFTGRYVIVPGDPVDDHGRLCDGVMAERVADAVRGQPAVLESATTKPKEQQPPLPYNLLKLQMDAARKFGYPPDMVKDVTQDLREKHRAITYNRSDSEYLSDEQHADAPGVLQAIAATAPVLAGAISRSNAELKSRAFNSSRVTAHHAIIPTATTVDFAVLNEAEQRIYLLVARAYVAQFYPTHQYDQSDLVVLVAGHRFGCRSNVTTRLGWLALYKNDSGNEDLAGAEDDLDIDLRTIRAGQTGVCSDATAERKATKPPALYTMATLLSDLTKVARYVRDERLRQILIDRDAGKTGEHGGIGTPATRDSIIRTLFDRQFLEEKGKAIVATPAGADFYDALPDAAKYPDMTAIWQEQQERIRAGALTIDAFILELVDHLRNQVQDVRENGISLRIDGPRCPRCGRVLRRRKGEHGIFWGCTGFKEGCKFSANDKDGKPVLEPKDTPPKSDVSPYRCEACGEGVQRRNGPRGPFWGCMAYPKCKKTYPDDDGKPAGLKKMRKKKEKGA
jgi:DNA topoisomerase-3